MADMRDAEPKHPPGWLPQEEFFAIYQRVPRLCVEVVIHEPERGVLLTQREIPPNIGAWHIPGGTVLFAESVGAATRRVARDELGLDVSVGDLLGYIEYPSHYENGLDSPVGLAMSCAIPPGSTPLDGRWFTELPDGLYAEQRRFLGEHIRLSQE
jgi:8-oxo-dGTP pyrophosphatase MutT (NUDIX family)